MTAVVPCLYMTLPGPEFADKLELNWGEQATLETFGRRDARNGVAANRDIAAIGPIATAVDDAGIAQQEVVGWHLRIGRMRQCHAKHDRHCELWNAMPRRTIGHLHPPMQSQRREATSDHSRAT